MNRLQRRKMKNKFKGQKVMMNPGIEKEDHRNDKWCHRHNLLLDNVSPQTDRDKRLIESVAYKTLKAPEKDGKITISKYCPRCHITMPIDTIETPLLRQ